MNSSFSSFAYPPGQFFEKKSGLFRISQSVAGGRHVIGLAFAHNNTDAVIAYYRESILVCGVVPYIDWCGFIPIEAQGIYYPEKSLALVPVNARPKFKDFFP
jgi:hypothetical protein